MIAGVNPGDRVSFRLDTSGPVGALPNDEFRYRVIDVLSLPSDPGWNVHGRAREFKTWDGAKRYRDQLLAEGARVLVQTGVLHWLTAEDNQ